MKVRKNERSCKIIIQKVYTKLTHSTLLYPSKNIGGKRNAADENQKMLSARNSPSTWGKAASISRAAADQTFALIPRPPSMAEAKDFLFSRDLNGRSAAGMSFPNSEKCKFGLFLAVRLGCPRQNAGPPSKAIKLYSTLLGVDFHQRREGKRLLCIFSTCKREKIVLPALCNKI